jgi:hypothetical protein
MKREIPAPFIIAVIAVVVIAVVGLYWQKLFGSVEHNYGAGPPGGIKRVTGPPPGPPPEARRGGGAGGPIGPPPGPPSGYMGR